MLFALITSFVWMLASIYALSYMSHEHKRTRFYFFLLLSLAANIGLILANDLFTLFIFFEGLGFFAYPLIIHSETEEAFKAGTKYLLMTVLGGLLLLAGVFLVYGYTGTLDLLPSLEHLEKLGYLKYLIAGLLIAGFGVKAGMIPLHIWLPDAHPVAPSPASALLSGIMIKAGAYGIIRVVSNIFRPSFTTYGAEIAEKIEHLWRSTSSLGYAIIWIGVITMFLGVCMALLQENAKRMLAYHSVSQMGYIIMGIGVAAYLGHEGGLGFAAAIYHIVNHALFKAALFLGVGAVYYRTGELNMYKLGGLWKKMPFVFLFTLIAAAGISGIPPFNGFASKTLLHEAIVESFEHSHLVSLKWAEIVFIITGGGTLCSFMKLIIFTFLGKREPGHETVKDAPWLMNVSMGALALGIIGLGVYPEKFLKNFLIPIVRTWSLPVEHLEEIHLFTAHNIQALLPSLAVGVLVFFVGTRYHLFHLHFPKWFGVDYWYGRLAQRSVVFADQTNRLNDFLEVRLSYLSPAILSVDRIAVKISEYLNKFVFAFTVDMWLPQPLSATQGLKEEDERGVETGMIDKTIDRAIDDLAIAGYKAGFLANFVDLRVIDRLVNSIGAIGQAGSKLANLFDLRVIDRIVNGIAALGEMTSRLAGLFDMRVIDKIVNAIGGLTKISGKKLRPIQTGDVQAYAFIFLASAVALCFFLLAIFFFF